MPDFRKLIIIGSGPAGYTAGIYTSRAELGPVLFAGEKAGGQLMLTTDVENWPGVKDGILGPELMMQMREQAEKFGTEIVDKFVTEVDFSGDEKIVRVGEEEHRARAVIIATGAEAMLLGVPGEKELMGKGVSTCAVCDAAFYRDKVTYVVGGGDAAVEEAMALTKFAKSVTMLVRRDQLKASKIMAKRVTENPKVTMRWNSELKEVKGKDKVESIVVESRKGKGVEGSNGRSNHPEKLRDGAGRNTEEDRITEELMAEGVFIAIGHRPMTDLFKDKVELDAKGFLVTHLNGMKEEVAEKVWLNGYPTMTSVPGVFGAGDVVDFRYKQAVTSAGFGCMAALDAERWLENH